jgi:hypothetical protein
VVHLPAREDEVHVDICRPHAMSTQTTAGRLRRGTTEQRGIGRTIGSCFDSALACSTKFFDHRSLRLASSGSPRMYFDILLYAAPNHLTFASHSPRKPAGVGNRNLFFNLRIFRPVADFWRSDATTARICSSLEQTILPRQMSYRYEKPGPGSRLL